MSNDLSFLLNETMEVFDEVRAHQDRPISCPYDKHWHYERFKILLLFENSNRTFSILTTVARKYILILESVKEGYKRVRIKKNANYVNGSTL